MAAVACGDGRTRERSIQTSVVTRGFRRGLGIDFKVTHRVWAQIAMNERERWIIYPLVFFALGAALRDKFMQHVSSKEIECQRLVVKSIECEGGIACEGVVVLDPENPNLRLVELGQAAPMEGVQGTAPRFGVFVLRDSGGRELCWVVNNELYVRQISCEGVRVVDPDDARRILAGLGSMAVPSQDAERGPQRFGVLALNNKEFGTLTGNPPRRAAPPQDAPSEDAPETEPENRDEADEEEATDVSPDAAG